eukprot:5365798-Alexandrium_andersonii.AAC.1
MLRRELYEFKGASKRVDVCDVCLEWDRKAAPAMRAAVKTAVVDIRDVVPEYFEQLQRCLLYTSPSPRD